MSVMRKLRRSGRSSHYRVEPLRQERSFPTRKMSDVLQDFAEPLLETADDDKVFANAISFAAFCWNMSFLSEKEQRKMMRDIVDEIVKSDALARLGAEDWARMLLERKKTFFADDRRIILDYKIVEENGRERLLVMSSLVKD